MVVIAHEIFQYLKAVLKAEEFSDASLMAEEIAAVGPGKSFIGRRSTFEGFRKEYWEPELFTHSNLGQWREMGSKSMWTWANETAKRKIREHAYRASDDVRKELDRIYERAKTDERLKESFAFGKK
jgi:trimethylamine--corrinoid protein Co-methyltransferase